MTTVGTDGEDNVPDMLSSAISSTDKVSNMVWELTPKLCRRKSKRLSVDPANREQPELSRSWTDPKLVRLSLRLALVTGDKRSSS